MIHQLDFNGNDKVDKAFEKMIENRGGYNETADGWLYWYINGIQRNDTTTNNGVVDSIEQTEREGE